MSAASLLADLARRGVVLEAEGDAVRWRAPRGVVSETDRSAIRAAKAELLAVLGANEARSARSARLIEEANALEAREMLGAIRLRLPGGMGEAWVVLAQGVFDDLVAEESKRPEVARRPVVWLADWCRLKGKSEDAIHTALEVWRAFPGSRLVH
ncbi:MAG: hypothetical protein FJ033_16475 [Chloroflexi bacterium]|nr:hypothetical protein [Chloroflexota bacterium]